MVLHLILKNGSYAVHISNHKNRFISIAKTSRNQGIIYFKNVMLAIINCFHHCHRYLLLYFANYFINDQFMSGKHHVNNHVVDTLVHNIPVVSPAISHMICILSALVV